MWNNAVVQYGFEWIEYVVGISGKHVKIVDTD